MNGKITILGTGTCQIQEKRMASSALAELDGLRIVYDFGRGTCQRLLEAGKKQDDINHVILSHFHPDHISDLIPFLHAGTWSKIDSRNSDLNIYGPPGVKDQVMKLINLFGPGELTSERFQINICEIEDKEFSINGQRFEFIELPKAPNHGLKFGFNERSFAFTGDSDFHRQEIDFLKGVKLAVVDAGHITDENIIELAVSTQVRTFVCSHLYRELDEERFNALAKKKGYEGRIIVGKDLMSFDI